MRNRIKLCWTVQTESKCGWTQLSLSSCESETLLSWSVCASWSAQDATGNQMERGSAPHLSTGCRIPLTNVNIRQQLNFKADYYLISVVTVVGKMLHREYFVVKSESQLFYRHNSEDQIYNKTLTLQQFSLHCINEHNEHNKIIHYYWFMIINISY